MLVANNLGFTPLYVTSMLRFCLLSDRSAIRPWEPGYREFRRAGSTDGDWTLASGLASGKATERP